MSFLDVQDLAAVAAQHDFSRLLAAWSADIEALLDPIEIGVVAALAGVLLRRRSGSRQKRARQP